MTLWLGECSDFSIRSVFAGAASLRILSTSGDVQLRLVVRLGIVRDSASARSRRSRCTLLAFRTNLFNFFVGQMLNAHE